MHKIIKILTCIECKLNHLLKFILYIGAVIFIAKFFCLYLNLTFYFGFLIGLISIVFAILKNYICCVEGIANHRINELNNEIVRLQSEIINLKIRLDEENFNEMEK